jgi:hypothetical protein
MTEPTELPRKPVEATETSRDEAGALSVLRPGLTPAGAQASLAVEPAVEDARAIAPGLISMLMFNSPRENVSRRIQVRGNAALTGRNGAGKTTMVKALLLFSGTPPSRIPTGEGKEKFIDYYFPWDTSAIAFCYANHSGDERLLVFHKTSAGLQARFFRCGMRDELFVEAGPSGPRNVPAAQLRARATDPALRIACSNAMTQADAMMALRGRLGFSSDERKLFGAEVSARDFALTPASARMDDIADICKAVEERKSTLPQLAEATARSAMVMAKLAPVEQADLGLEMEIDPALASLLPSMRGIYAANAASEEFASAARADAAASAALAWQGSARWAFDAMATDLEAKQAATEAEFATLHASDQVRETLFTRQIDEARDKEKDGASLAATLGAGAASKRAEGERLKKKNGPEWLAKQSDRPTVQARIDTANQELSILEGTSAEIASELRERHRQDHEASAQLEKENILNEIGAAEAATSQQRKDLAAELARQFKALDDKRAPSIAAARQAENEAQGASRAEATLAVVAGAPPEAVLALREAQDALAATMETASSARAASAKASAALADRNRAVDKARDELAKAKADAAARQQDLQKIQAWANPNPASILAAIRSQPPAVAEAFLATFSDRALLEARVRGGTADAAAGWLGLDIDAAPLLSPPTEAAEREEAIGKAEAKARKALDDALARDAAAAEALATAESEAKTAKEEVAAAADAARLTDQALDVARAAKGDKERELRKAERQAKEQAQAKVQAAREAAEARRRDREAAEREAENARKALSSQFDTKTRQVEAALAQKLDELKRRKANVERALSDRRDSLERMIQADLKRQGKDFEAIKAKTKALNELRRELAEIKNHEHLAQEWRRWKETTEASIADDELNASTAQETSRAAAADGQLLRAERDAARAQARERALGLQKQVDELSRDRRMCLEKLSELSQAPPSGSDMALSLAALAPATLARMSADKRDELARTRADRSRHLAKCHEVFRQHPGSPPEQFWRERKHAEPTSGGADEKDAHWCEAYRAWHQDGAGETHGKALVTHAKLLGVKALVFRNQLEQFKSACGKTGRKIAEGIEKTAENGRSGRRRFKSVSDLSIEVDCNLNSLSFFPALALAASEHEVWIDSKAPTPPESLLKALASLMEHARGAPRLRVELDELVVISGSVMEVDRVKQFSTKQGISNLSSNGLSYLIVLMVQLAFLNQARAQCPTVRVTWAVDELRDLDNENAMALLDLLRENQVDLVCAFPDPDSPVLHEQIEHIYGADTDGSFTVYRPASAVANDDRARRRDALAKARAKSEQGDQHAGEQAANEEAAP